MNGKRLMKLSLVLAGLAVAAWAGAMPVTHEAARFVTNYPNPFDSRSEHTTITYSLPGESEVRVRIYDLLGNVVREYPARKECPGIGRVVWDGTDAKGEKVARGGYICVLEVRSNALQYSATRKIGVVH